MKQACGLRVSPAVWQSDIRTSEGKGFDCKNTKKRKKSWSITRLRQKQVGYTCTANIHDTLLRRCVRSPPMEHMYGCLSSDLFIGQSDQWGSRLIRHSHFKTINAQKLPPTPSKHPACTQTHPSSESRQTDFFTPQASLKDLEPSLLLLWQIQNKNYVMAEIPDLHHHHNLISCSSAHGWTVCQMFNEIYPNGFGQTVQIDREAVQLTAAVVYIGIDQQLHLIHTSHTRNEPYIKWYYIQ